MDEKRKKVGAAWKRTTGSGKAFLSIAINEAIEAGAKLTMWPNGFKETSKHPDYIIYADQAKAPAPDLSGLDDSEIPF